MFFSMIKKIIDKYDKIPPAAKSSFWFVVCSILQKGIAFLTTPIFTRLMSPEQYGQFTIYNSWVEVFFVFATLDVFYGVYNNALTKYSDDRDRVTSTMLGFCSSLTLIVFVVYLFFYDLINSLTKISMPMTILLFCEILIMPAYYLWSAKERYNYRYKKLIVVTLLIALLTPLLGVPAVSFSAEKGLARIITSVIVQTAIAAVLYVSIFKRGKVFFIRKYWKYALTFNLPLIPHYLSSMILNQSDRLMIDRMCGTDKAGIYGLAYTLGAMLIMINTAITNSLTPYTYQSLKKNDFLSVKEASNYLVILVAALALIVLLIAPEIMIIMGGSQYSEGMYIIAPIAASVYFRFLYSLYGNIEFYYEENFFIMIASVCCALLNVVTNYIFIKMYGFLAAGFTTLGCFAIYSFAHFIFSQRVLRKHTNQLSLYNNKLIFSIGLILIIMSIGIIQLYPFPIIRYGAVFICTSVMFVKKNQMINLVKRLKKK